MLPWTWKEVNSRGRAQGQRGAGLGRGSGRGRGRKRPRFNEYVVVPSSSVTTRERVKFASQPYGGLAASRQDVFRPSEASCSADPFNAAPANVDDFSYDEHSEYYVPMDQDPSLDEEVGSQNKRRRTAGVCV